MELWKPFADAFQTDALTLFKTDHWTVMVRKGQATLGSLVLAANRNFVSAAELTRDEVLEFPQVVARLDLVHLVFKTFFAFWKILFFSMLSVFFTFELFFLPLGRFCKVFPKS